MTNTSCRYTPDAEIESPLLGGRPLELTQLTSVHLEWADRSSSSGLGPQLGKDDPTMLTREVVLDIKIKVRGIPIR